MDGAPARAAVPATAPAATDQYSSSAYASLVTAAVVAIAAGLYSDRSAAERDARVPPEYRVAGHDAGTCESEC